MTLPVLTDGNSGNPVFVLAHGAGADCRSDFMTEMAGMLSAQGLYVVRFNFSYMLKREQDGKKRPPDRAPVLLQYYADLIRELDRPCVIGGKSMGGRMASLLANDEEQQALFSPLIRGCACLGYPFHPPGKPDRLRTEHLKALTVPTLIAQGTRDTMGTREEIEGYGLDGALQLHWLEDGNHDLKPRKASGFTHQQHMESTAVAVAEFVKDILG